jgi:hypothetical protein
MVDHHRAVATGVQVQLDAVGVEENRPAERRPGVLILVA